MGKYLKGIRVGQIVAKTCHNKWFGISDEVDVQLLVISVGTSVNQGEFVDFHDYDLLIQEIVDALGSGGDDLFARAIPTVAETVTERPKVLLGSPTPVEKTLTC